MHMPMDILLKLAVIYFAFFFLRSVVIVGVGSFLVFKSHFRNKKVFNVPLEKDQLKIEAKAALRALAFDACVFAVVLHFNLIPFVQFSWTSFFTTFFLMFVVFEVWFYWTHRLLHLPRFFFIHREHHIARVTSPITALSFSMIERLIALVGIFGLPALLGHYIPFCLEGMFFYGTFNLLMNFLGHSNLEYHSENYGNGWMSKVFGSTTFHALHHARMTGHFGLFTTIQDHLFGTVHPDFYVIQSRTSRGQSLTSLNFRVKKTPAIVPTNQSVTVEL
jgi:lathosterol oxidase